MWSRTAAIEVYFRFELFVFVLKTKKKDLFLIPVVKVQLNMRLFLQICKAGFNWVSGRSSLFFCRLCLVRRERERRHRRGKTWCARQVQYRDTNVLSSNRQMPCRFFRFLRQLVRFSLFIDSWCIQDVLGNKYRLSWYRITLDILITCVFEDLQAGFFYEMYKCALFALFTFAVDCAPSTYVAQFQFLCRNGFRFS